MAFVPPARHLLHARDLADARYFEPLGVDDMADDCQASYEELKGRGVEFTEAPEERPYRIDSGFRDPSGNSIRLAEVTMAGV